METRSRSLAKAITWRVTGTLDTVAVAFLITGNIAAAVSISAIDVVTKLILYYVHERLWARTSFGRQ